VLVHQSPYRSAVGAELGGHLDQQPFLHQQPVSQVRPQVGEAELCHTGGKPLVGGVAALTGQPLSTWEQLDPALAQCPFDCPLAHFELGGQPWDAVAVVAAGLQVAAQVGEAEALGALLQLAGAAVVDHKPAVDGQLPRRLRWWVVYPSFRRTGSPAAPGAALPSAASWRRSHRWEGSPRA
jgi:hypothetical protein